jgi:hypothetical protein
MDNGSHEVVFEPVNGNVWLSVGISNNAVV